LGLAKALGVKVGSAVKRCPQRFLFNTVCVGLVINTYIRCIYDMFGREITKDTVMYGVYMRFWPTLCMCAH